MILGFSHLTVGCVCCNGGWNTHKMIPSSKNKWPLMMNRANYHDITIVNGKLVTLELIHHDTGLVNRPSRLYPYGFQQVGVRARNVTEEIWFLSALGERRRRDIAIESAVSGWKCTLHVAGDKAAPIDPPLDIHGYAAIAMYSNDLETDMNALVDHGGRDALEPWDISVGPINMTVTMCRSPEGTIVELIKIRSGCR